MYHRSTAEHHGPSPPPGEIGAPSSPTSNHRNASDTVPLPSLSPHPGWLCLRVSPVKRGFGAWECLLQSKSHPSTGRVGELPHTSAEVSCKYADEAALFRIIGVFY